MIQSCNTIKARPNLNFGVKLFTVQFYAIEHNSKSTCWTEFKLYHKIQKVLVYVGVNFQVNRSSEMTCNIGQNRLYEFCYLLPFDLWTSYLVRIIFLKGCGFLFWKFPSSTRIFNELKHDFQG